MSPKGDSLDRTLEEMGIEDEYEIEHVYPLGGISEHKIGDADCPCGPLMDMHNGTIFVIHRSWDKSRNVEFFQAIHGVQAL